jgi:hypothetical protein
MSMITGSSMVRCGGKGNWDAALSDANEPIAYCLQPQKPSLGLGIALRLKAA